MVARLKRIRMASWVGIFGNIILALLKITLGLISGSLAVVGDGLDSTTDIFSFLITLFATRIMAKEPDQKHPYGHHRAEALATLLIAFIILFAGLQLLIFSLTKIFRPGATEVPTLPAIIATLISIGVKLLLALYQFKIGKSTDSSMLIANGRNMLSDVLLSSGVLLGTALTIMLKIPLLDQILAVLISFWIMRTAIHLFLSTNTELMDGLEDTSIYEAIFAAVDEVDQVYNPHRTRVRKLANLYLIDLDIEVDGNLTVAEGHQLAIEVEQALRRSIENLYDIAVHVEPLGNIESGEKYGLSSQELLNG
ncbi:MAG: cation transporter [Firmicutes bacterium]|nr:cation transporter [Bacillota bacterium]